MCKDERKAVILTASRHVLEYARQNIWLPRCKAVEAALGPWRTRTTQDHQTASPGQAPHELMRARRHGRRPTPSWDAINKRAFDTEAHLKMVASEWTD